jgi:galactokinase
MMYGAHESYRDNCRLSVPEVNFLVEAVRKRGRKRALRRENHRRRHRRHRGRLWQNRRAQGTHPANRRGIFPPRGAMPDIFEGTSPGAIEFGAKRYAFGANGWQRFEV